MSTPQAALGDVRHHRRGLKHAPAVGLNVLHVDSGIPRVGTCASLAGR